MARLLVEASWLTAVELAQEGPSHEQRCSSGPQTSSLCWRVLCRELSEAVSPPSMPADSQQIFRHLHEQNRRLGGRQRRRFACSGDHAAVAATIAISAGLAQEDVGCAMEGDDTVSPGS
jgi:hypothetical protein